MTGKEHLISPGKVKVSGSLQPEAELKKKLEIVLKTDSIGTEEAILAAIKALEIPGVTVEVIEAGIGHVSKSDLFLAETGSRLVLGFHVDILPKIKEMAKDHQIEVRLYEVIYNLLDDLKKLASTLVQADEKEKVTGRAEVIALFPGGRKGIILGCEVLEGTLVLGKKFRLISAPIPVYTGTIESLHIEKDAVKEAGAGKQVGLKIEDFHQAKIGDFVECFEVVHPKNQAHWRPRGGVFRY